MSQSVATAAEPHGKHLKTWPVEGCATCDRLVLVVAIDEVLSQHFPGVPSGKRLSAAEHLTQCFQVWELTKAPSRTALDRLDPS